MAKSKSDGVDISLGNQEACLRLFSALSVTTQPLQYCADLKNRLNISKIGHIGRQSRIVLL